MSVARKTPKFAENPYFKSPLRQSRKSTSPSPSRMMHTSPFSQSVKASNNSGRKSPYSTATLKESVEALRQLRDYNNTVGSGSKELRDIKATIYDRKEFEIITDFEKKHPQNAMNDIPPPMRNHISKVEAFIASRMPKKEEDPIKPHNLAWRTASHDAQARLLKEGATANQWPAPNLLEKMGGLYNKYIDDPSTSNEAIVKENPLRKSGMSVSTRKSTKLEEDHYAIEHDRYNNNNKENRFSYERRSVKESREPRLSYTSTASKQAEEYQSRGKAELERMKVEAKRTQNQMKGKIDFINSLYEEMAMQPREKPLMPSHRPVSPALDSRETPRSLMLVDDREIDALESSRRRKNENRNENSRESRSRDIREERRVYNNNNHYDNSINEKNTTFGDENYEEKRRPGSIQRTTAAHHNRTPSNLSIPRKVISGSNTSSLRSLNLAGSEYEGLESGNRGIGNNREFPNFEENFKGGDTERRRENNRPPLPGKRQQENDSNGFEQQDWAGDKGTPLQKSRSTFNPEPKSTKNFIEMNKSSSGVKSKKYANYEKVLRNIEETCKPLLETLKKISNKNEKELSLRCTANRKGMWSPCSAVSSSAKKDPKRKSSNSSTAVSPMKKELPFDKTLNIEGLGNNGSSIKNFYDEMNNLTLKITEAAGVMQKTLDQLERYKVEDTERGGRSARNREENFREINRFGYGEENEEESEIY